MLVNNFKSSFKIRQIFQSYFKTLAQHFKRTFETWVKFKSSFKHSHNFKTSFVEYGIRVDKIVDISTPPNGYHLLGMEFHWGAYPFFSDKISISLIFDNLLDKSYRNYLNRLRFYADEMGRNVMLQIKINH